jgi:hydroxymethylpyrimidine pyrophosphatase-like HAD family hydrolase
MNAYPVRISLRVYNNSRFFHRSRSLIMPLTPLTQASLPPIRLVATDMDGTLTCREKFTPALFDALEQLQRADIPVVIVTGRSAGWVSAVSYYFPIAGAICENGGLFYQGERSELLVDVEITPHRQALATMFDQLQQRFPTIQPSHDNPFRLTDWTFDVAGLTDRDLATMAAMCADSGWGFTYSTVQCHIKLPQQEKAIGLQQVLQRHFPGMTREQVVTVGDSPNDVSLFDPAIFPWSVGVQNVSKYTEKMQHQPTFITENPEGRGFCELVSCLLSKK